MIGHAAYPDIPETVRQVEGEYNRQGVREVISKVVKEYISQPGAYKKPDNNPYCGVLNRLFRVGITLILDPVEDESVGYKEGHQVHEAVIPNLE